MPMPTVVFVGMLVFLFIGLLVAVIVISKVYDKIRRLK
jgi:hypothetical protein